MTTTFIDGHVHFYQCFEASDFLEGAYENFSREAARLNTGKEFAGVLLFTETSHDHWFSRLVGYADEGKSISCANKREWAIERTSEECSLFARRSEEESLILVAGRQIVTKERLEVLAIGTAETFRERQPIHDVLKAVAEVNAIPVVPWGFGKWLGDRGKVVDALLEDPPVSPFFLGDNANRLMLGLSPAHFRRARQKGVNILPGTDPLPFPSESRRPGSFGFYTEQVLSRDTPALDLRNHLSHQTLSIGEYGSLEGPYRFVKHQVSMQLRKVLGVTQH